MAAISEDLPALGNPTRPMSATVLSSRVSSRSSPGSPLSANPGALRRCEARAALPRPPLPPAAAMNCVPCADQVGEHLAVLVKDDRAARDPDDLVVAGGAVPVRPLALMAVGRLADRPPVEVEQRGRGRVDLEDHAAAAAAVAAVRAAKRLEFLPVDRRAAMTAVASLHPEYSVVGEFRHVCPLPSSSGAEPRTPNTTNGGPVIPARRNVSLCAC